MGDGYIDVPAIPAMVARAGSTGPIEVEISRGDIWATPALETIGIMAERYRELVLLHA